MNNHDRLAVNKNRLCDLIQFNDLVPFLLQREIINQKLIEEIESRPFGDVPKIVNSERNKCLLDFLIAQSINDRNYEKLVECLIETGHSHAAKIIKPESDFTQYCSSSISSSDEDQMPLLRVKLSEKCKTGRKYYKMVSKPRGYCLIVNNVDFENRPEEKRLGSDKDAQRLSTVFEELGFDVIQKRNISSQDMLDFFRTYSRDANLANHDALVVVMLSHGDAEEIFGTDYLRVNIRDVLEFFNNENCPLLKGKPKMFFLGACRGGRRGKFESSEHELSGSFDAATFEEIKKDPEEQKINARNLGPLYSDMLISYSTVYGFVSHRDPTSGSWYCETLAQMLVEHSCDKRLIDLLNKVDELVQARTSEQGCKQTTSYEVIGFNKKLYFNPGHYPG